MEAVFITSHDVWIDDNVHIGEAMKTRHLYSSARYDFPIGIQQKVSTLILTAQSSPSDRMLGRPLVKVACNVRNAASSIAVGLVAFSSPNFADAKCYRVEPGVLGNFPAIRNSLRNQ